MLNKNLHPSDEDLLLFSDGELSARAAARVRRHLAACWSCRARDAKIEATIGEFMEIHGQTFGPAGPPIAGSRALLRARLAQSSLNRDGDGGQPSFLSAKARGLAYVCALVLLIALGARVLIRYARAHETAEYGRLLPNPTLTPGATRPVAIGDLCSTDHDQVVLPISGTLRQKVFDEYGMQGEPFENYEVDYLITPGLGGSEDIRNLWPQPRYNAAWNSFVKDRLEDYLHQMVCQRKLNLATAQKDVARNWISAYKKYFHTNAPLSPDASGVRTPRLNARRVDFIPLGETRQARSKLYWTLLTIISTED